MHSSDDIKFMKRCLQLAKCGIMDAPPNPMVGAVIVYNGRIIGEGYHRRCGEAHAEVNAVNSVREPHLLPESTIYVSLEPCAHYGKTPPCADLIIEKGIPRIVVGCMDPFAKVNGLGIKKLRDAGREVVVGVLEEECLALNSRFITFHAKGRPWITLKWAQSSDGFIDAERTAEQPATKFSTPLTLTLVHRLRAMHQAILVGTGTALMDNPTLTNRLWTGRNPLRAVIDRHHRLDESCHLMDGTVPTVVYDHGNLKDILADLHERGVQSLLVEGGSRLHESFIAEGLWDEIRVETAPIRLEAGVKAPSIAHLSPCSVEEIDERSIATYRHEM